MTSVTIEGNNVTENPSRKSVTPMTIEGNNVTENPSRKSVTLVTTESNNVTENPYRKSVTPGPDWLRVGDTTLKDEEKSILYLPNAWLNDRIVDAVQEILKRQFPHICFRQCANVRPSRVLIRHGF